VLLSLLKSEHLILIWPIRRVGSVLAESYFRLFQAIFSNFDLANQARWFSFGWELFSLISSDLFWLYFALSSTGLRLTLRIWRSSELCSRSESALRLWFYNLPY
jgi:hypothetical protein